MDLAPITSQMARGKVALISIEEEATFYDRRRKVYRKFLPRGREVTREQIAGFRMIIKSGAAPYLDFGVWGPNHHRLVRKLRFNGAMLIREGGFKDVEILGPLVFHMWSGSFDHAAAACVGFDEADIGALENHWRRSKTSWVRP